MFRNVAEGIESIEDAPLGVFAYVTRSGRPAACAVTPYVVEGHPVVTSTLAYVAKARAVRADDRVALLAAGLVVEGRGRVGIDRSAAWFDRNLRRAELRKYPPAAAVLGIPGHRCWFPWYVGRAVIGIDAEREVVAPGSDRVAVAVVAGDGRLLLRPRPGEPPAAGSTEVELGAVVPDGPGVVLVHEESPDLAELRQLALHGVVVGGRLRVERSVHTDLGGGGAWAQLRTARDLAARARAARPLTAGWPPPPVG